MTFMQIMREMILKIKLLRHKIPMKTTDRILMTSVHLILCKIDQNLTQLEYQEYSSLEVIKRIWNSLGYQCNMVPQMLHILLREITQ